MELSVYPDWNIDRTFAATFYFPQKLKKVNKTKTTYRNPIYMAKEYKKMIDSGEVKNQSELVRIKGISRARVTQIMNLLKLNKKFLYKLEKFGDPMDKKVISERKLRSFFI